MEHRLVQSAGVVHPHHDLGQHVLEYPRRREKISRTDLSAVLDHRFRTFGTGDTEARGKRLAIRENVIADPSHRKVGNQCVVFGEIVEQIAVLAGDDDVLVAEHHAFGLSGRAGRIQHDADIGPATAIDLGLPTCGDIGAGTQFRAAGVAHLVVRMQQRAVVFQEAPRVVVNDGAQRRHTIGDRQQLVDLFLIFDDGHRHLGMRQHEDQLLRDRVLVNWNRNCAERLRGGESPVKPRTIVAEERNRIVALQPKRAEPQRESANFLKNISPGIGLPDAETSSHA